MREERERKRARREEGDQSLDSGPYDVVQLFHFGGVAEHNRSELGAVDAAVLRHDICPHRFDHLRKCLSTYSKHDILFCCAPPMTTMIGMLVVTTAEVFSFSLLREISSSRKTKNRVTSRQPDRNLQSQADSLFSETYYYYYCYYHYYYFYVR